ncbi:hypothetical protein AVEN_175153-1 [Araneus ventricosus]|uniref:Uncharacterized protein n=1 Tax=Araneus ventricosus TaxID=182803 RepID=A0A4Y2RJN8_ARAVE|nr:hypothetical protein AVEN_176799-1 [Araneus ventricosus]GBN75861.1 hypothetical protein AVEN_175153-1 [Araneus ventricosus]
MASRVQSQQQNRTPLHVPATITFWLCKQCSGHEVEETSEDAPQLSGKLGLKNETLDFEPRCDDNNITCICTKFEYFHATEMPGNMIHDNRFNDHKANTQNAISYPSARDQTGHGTV